MIQARSQPSRTRAVALQISSLCEISSDLLLYFYHPTNMEKPMGKQAELKKLSELHTRLEAWRKNLPKEMDPKEGQLPSVLVMQSVLFDTKIIAEQADTIIACFFNSFSFTCFAHFSNTIKPLPHCLPTSRLGNSARMLLQWCQNYFVFTSGHMG